MKKNQRSIKSFLTPPVVVFGLCLILFLVTLYFTHRTRAYNSDDVFWQNILLSWTPFNGHQVALGNSVNYLDKVPLFGLLGYFFSPSRKLLFLESSLFGVAGFASFYWASLYFLKKAGTRLTYVNLLPFVWLASFGYSFAQLYLNPDWRGFEVGLSFVLFMLVAKFYYGEINFKSWPNKLLGGLLVLVAGLLIYSDPYYLYFTIAPLLLFSLVLVGYKKISGKQASVVFAGTLLSLIIAKVTGLIAYQTGLRTMISIPLEFVTFDKLPKNIMDSIHGLLINFGANPFGKPVIATATFSAVVNLLLLILIIIRLARQPVNKDLSMIKLWGLFFAATSWFAFIVYTSSTLTAVLAYRYLFMFVFTSVLYLALYLGSLKTGKKLVAAGLVVATTLNIVITLSGSQGFLQAGSLGNKGNRVNYQLIDTLRSKNLTKGYANYWQGIINTYLSQNSVEFLPVSCPGGRTTQFHWLIDKTRFDKPADRSFYIIDPDFKDVDSCTFEQITTQFGQPEEVVTVSNKKILIYSYDLQPKTQN